MIFLLILGGAQALMLFFLLLGKRSIKIPDYILSGYLLLSALIILLAYLEIWNRNSGYPYPWLINISTPFILLIGPAIWLYVKSLTDQHFRFKPVYLLLLFPFLLVVTMLMVGNYLKPDSAKIIIEQTEQFKGQPSFFVIITLIALSNLGYTLWGLILIGRYRKKLKTYFSQTDSINLAWLRFLLISAFVCYASISLLYLADAFFNLMSYHTLQLIAFGIASVFVLVLGFFGIKQGDVFTSIPDKFDMDGALATSFSSKKVEKREEEFVHSLLSYMRDSKPYQNPDITIASLAKELNVSPEYLSSIINGRLNLNYFDFINHFRIEEFKAMCKNPKNKNFTLIGLAYDCGFNSKATFNRVFRKVVGRTPSEYLKSLK
ncbi:MAG: helix-turn-helix domain-containing protein [Bacteroidales bacterium]